MGIWILVLLVKEIEQCHWAITLGKCLGYFGEYRIVDTKKSYYHHITADNLDANKQRNVRAYEEHNSSKWIFFSCYLIIPNN